MTKAIDKGEVLSALRRHQDEDLNVVTESQLESQAGATHSENRAEGDKDMRATESSYLARGLAKRVGELRSCVSSLGTLRLREFGSSSPVSLSALVTVEDEEGVETHYFIAPCGGGVVVEVGGERISVITPSSPIGIALIGRMNDDETELRTPQGVRMLTISEIR